MKNTGRYSRSSYRGRLAACILSLSAGIIGVCFSSGSMGSGSSDSDSSDGTVDSHWTLDNTVRSFNVDAAEPTRAGHQFWFADKNFLDGRTLKLSVVRPGQSTHAPHQHGEDEFFFVLQGTAEFHLNGETRVVGPMTSLYCPPNSMHGIKNVGTTELQYLVIKKYQLQQER